MGNFFLSPTLRGSRGSAILYAFVHAYTVKDPRCDQFSQCVRITIVFVLICSHFSS